MNGFLILLGVLLLFGAVFLFITSLMGERGGRRVWALLMVLMGIVCFLAGMTVVSVGPNERMVVFNRITGNLGEPHGPGLAIINPLTTSYKIYDLSRQTYTMSRTFDEGNQQGDDAVSARTSGGQEIYVDITVIYRINPDTINDVHRNWPDGRYQNELIRPLIRSVIRDAVSLFSVESVYQERGSIDKQIEDTVIPALAQEGFDVLDILVRDVNFTPEYAAAIEQAQIAEVNIREQEFRVKSVEQEAQQVEARAQGDANARIIQAQADAQALQLVADVLSQNPQLLEYQYIQNLGDQVQLIALPANSPFIFDLGQYQNTLPTATPVPEN